MLQLPKGIGAHLDPTAHLDPIIFPARASSFSFLPETIVFLISSEKNEHD